MRKLLIYLKDYKKESIIGPLFKLLEATFELIVPVIMAHIIDIGIKNHDTLYIWKRADMFIAGTIFCGEGSSWIWNCTQA